MEPSNRCYILRDASHQRVSIHAVRSCFNDKSTEGVLLVDATNAFNSLNRNAALLNICHLCPALPTIVINCCRESVNLFVGRISLKSQEGTKQGNPLPCWFIGLPQSPLSGNFTIPLMPLPLREDLQHPTIIRHSDHLGPSYGYMANGKKTWLLVKDHLSLLQGHRC